MPRLWFARLRWKRTYTTSFGWKAMFVVAALAAITNIVHQQDRMPNNLFARATVSVAGYAFLVVILARPRE